MRIIHTHDTAPGSLTPFEREMAYNGLDCCVTLEVMEALAPQLDTHTAATYAFSKSLQGPVLEMRCRGVLVDQRRKAEVIDVYFEQLDQLERQLDLIVLDGVGMATFNWRSNHDLRKLFYEELAIPPVRRGGSVSTDRSARDRLYAYTVARQIVAHINLMADIGKKIGVLRTAIDPDGRIRTSYNIGGTSTGRFSSSVSEFGTGGNLQNVEELLRSIFVADPGMKFAKFDAKSGESFFVGGLEWNLFQDDTYLNVCETGDPHTAAARMCWPELPWTGVLKKDKAFANGPYYRHHTYRNTTKKLGHASNYGGLPVTLSTMHGLPVGVVQQFQQKYFAAFPCHLRWHEHVQNEIYQRGMLISLMGRKRYFMGRRNDDKTLREAIAYDPQECLATLVNRAMRRCWRAGHAALMMNDHDALTFMYPEADEDKIIPLIQADLVESVPLEGGRFLKIPYDCEVGWNKGHASDENPEGLKEYVGHDDRKRSPEVSILDRIVRRTYRKH